MLVTSTIHIYFDCKVAKTRLSIYKKKHFLILSQTELIVKYMRFGLKTFL